jgi:hypothetical protein
MNALHSHDFEDGDAEPLLTPAVPIAVAATITARTILIDLSFNFSSSSAFPGADRSRAG